MQINKAKMLKRKIKKKREKVSYMHKDYIGIRFEKNFFYSASIQKARFQCITYYEFCETIYEGGSEGIIEQ
jgi:hypothetical protein